MKNYFARAARQFLKLAILLAIMMTLISLSDTGRVSGAAIFESLSSMSKALLVLVVWGVIYPLYGFTKKRVRCHDMFLQKDKIVNAFLSCNYMLESIEQGRMTFRPKSLILRLFYAYDDRVTVTAEGVHIVVEGLRREVVRIEPRLRTFVSMQL